MPATVCVIGGGPSGIFISKCLAHKGINVDLYEKNSYLLGNYSFSRYSTDIVKNLKSEHIKVFLNTDLKNVDKSKYDFFVVATGGEPRNLNVNGGSHAIQSLKVIKKLYKKPADIQNTLCMPSQKPNEFYSPVSVKYSVKNNIFSHLEKFFNFFKTKINNYTSIEKKDNYVLEKGEKNKNIELLYQITPKFTNAKDVDDPSIKNLKNKDICIIGLGNVTLDLIHYLKGFVKSITVLARSSLDKCPFSNYVLRETLDDKIYLNKVVNPLEKSSSRLVQKRYDIIQKALNHSFMTKVAYFLSKIIKKPLVTDLNLLCQSDLKEITIDKHKKAVTYASQSKLHKSLFDEVICSIGFIPNKIKVDTFKPVYYLGWAEEANGNIGDMQIKAKELASNITNTDSRD